MQDFEVFSILEEERKRQNNSIELIASENFVSKSVLDAVGSVFINKYAEGYPDARYYDGCEYIDKLEILAIERLKKLFNCKYANVQPHSGSCANQAAFSALINPGDKILGMSLDCGGHLTHGFKKNLSGMLYESYSYGVNKDTKLIDYDEVEGIALEVRPKLIIAGFSAYPRIIDWKKFREIADKVGAFFLCDIAHVAGLVATGEYPSSIEYAHITTSTTHKTLRGARGGIIMTNDEQIAKKINSAVFPRKQGGPLMNMIAGKAVCFGEALSEDFKKYTKNVIKNSKILSETLIKNGIHITSGGTDNHMVLVDLTYLNINGSIVSKFLDKIGITCNKNGVPFDKLSPMYTSGIRLGTAAMTTKGLQEMDFVEIGNIISKSIYYIANLTRKISEILKTDQNKILFDDLTLEISDDSVENDLKKECLELIKRTNLDYFK